MSGLFGMFLNIMILYGFVMVSVGNMKYLLMFGSRLKCMCEYGLFGVIFFM